MVRTQKRGTQQTGHRVGRAGRNLRRVGTSGRRPGRARALRGALMAVGLGLKEAAVQELGMISCVSRSSFPSSSRPLRFCVSLAVLYIFSHSPHMHTVRPRKLVSIDPPRPPPPTYTYTLLK